MPSRNPNKSCTVDPCPEVIISSLPKRHIPPVVESGASREEAAASPIIISGPENVQKAMYDIAVSFPISQFKTTTIMATLKLYPQTLSEAGTA